MPLGSYSLPPGIRFNDCFFSEPARLEGWTPPKCAGLFGIFIADPNWAPKPFQPLYFGEFGNNVPAQALFGECRNVLAQSSGKTLLIAVLPLPFSTTSQRQALQRELVQAYNPVCQGPSAADHRGPELHPEAPKPRRAIGFLASSEPAH